jgi:hypothetical protein
MTTSFGWGIRGSAMTGWLGGVAALAWVGCAAPTTALRRPSEDIRGNTLVSGSEARPLVAGPMKLLHVNSDGRTEPRFSRVWQRAGTADCHNGTPLVWNGETAVEIGPDELVCVAADGPARVSWHGRTVARDFLAASRQASLR